jgi:ribosomal protein S14
MPITMHDFIVLWLGVFIGLFLGNQKFRKMCSDFVAHLGKMKPKEEPKQEKQQRVDGACRLCGKSGSLAIVYGDNSGVCRQCLQEITNLQNHHNNRRGTTIREIHFDD